MKKTLQGPHQEPPEEPTGPSPTITPEMLDETFRILESKGRLHFAEGGVYVPTEKGWKLLMRVGKMKEEIVAWGNEKVEATNTDFMTITKSSEIPDDSTIAVRADKSCKDFAKDFKHMLKEAKKVEVTIEAGGILDRFTAYGTPALKLNDVEKLSFSKNDKITKSTVAIMSSKSASDLKQELIEKLRNSKNQVKITIETK